MKKNNYHQIGNAYIEFAVTVRQSDTIIFHNDDPIRSVKNAFVLYFKEAHLCTIIGSDIEHIRLCGQIYTIMKVISNKDEDFLSQFDKINEKNIPILGRIINLTNQIRDTPLRKNVTEQS